MYICSAGVKSGFIGILNFTFVNMETLKVDRTKLKTVTNYAKDIGVTRQTVYNMAKDKKVKIVVIDGVQFVQI